MKIKLVNAFAGLGGNRKYWQGVQVTAIESNEAIAAVYKKLYPDDVVIIADAYQYTLIMRMNLTLFGLRRLVSRTAK